jgi:hypothetical protein
MGMAGRGKFSHSNPAVMGKKLALSPDGTKLLSRFCRVTAIVWDVRSARGHSLNHH